MTGIRVCRLASHCDTGVPPVILVARLAYKCHGDSVGVMVVYRRFAT
jgi:hypothetical protein